MAVRVKISTLWISGWSLKVQKSMTISQGALSSIYGAVSGKAAEGMRSILRWKNFIAWIVKTETNAELR